MYLSQLPPSQAGEAGTTALLGQLSLGGAATSQPCDRVSAAFLLPDLDDELIHSAWNTVGCAEWVWCGRRGSSQMAPRAQRLDRRVSCPSAWQVGFDSR